MINPDNTINTRNDPKKIERSSKPEGAVDQSKFRDVYAVHERKKSQEELQEEWDDVASESAKTEQSNLTGTDKFKKVKKEVPQHSKPVSLFDLAKDKSQDGETQVETKKGKEYAFPQDPRMQQALRESPLPKAKENSLFDLASHQEAVNPQVKDAVVVETKQKVDKYIPETPDLAQVNILSQAPIKTEVGVEAPLAPKPPVDIQRLQKIIDEIVDRVYQLEVKGENSTVITISNKNSQFDGVSIKITEFDSSKGQFNITIDNLTAQTKSLVESQQFHLMEALKEKGYQVQQFIATTTLETPRLDDMQAKSRGSDEREQNKNGSNPDRQSKEDQEEET